MNVFATKQYQQFKKTASTGEYIRTYRENLGMTQAQLGQKLGKSRFFVCDLEKNRREISKQTALQLSQLFGVSTDRFLIKS